MTAKWVSFHLYRTQPLGEFLNEVVAPFVKTVLAERLASSFFFIRFWEGGPHIRLRFRTNAPDPLVRRTRSHFESYFERHPSAHGGASNDGMREIAYEPEVARYGGAKGIVVSEQQFEASSRAVLAAMSERAWSYESAIGCAVQLHIMFMAAMGFDLQEAAEFFAAVSNGFGGISGWLPPGLTPADAVGQFAALFSVQRDRLVALHRDVWSVVKDGGRFEQRWANRWVRDNLEVARLLRRARGLAEGQPWTPAERSIMTSYVHMTNNRLGIVNQDEAYVAYLVMRGFQEAA